MKVVSSAKNILF